MNRIDALMNRRSIRKFQARSVEREKLESVLRAAMQAPTAKNSQCWEFLVVEEPEALEAIAQMSPFAMCAKNARAAILPMVNKQRLDDPESTWWVEDLSAATENALIQIEAEGLGATWLGMYPYPERVQAVQEYFRLPEHLVPFAVIALGYKLKEKAPEDRYDPEKVHWGRYENGNA